MSTPPKTRGRGVAALLSFFVPGLGQVYLGAARRGVLWASAPVLLTMGQAALAPELTGTVMAFVAASVLVLWVGAMLDVAITEISPERLPPAGRLVIVGLLFFLASRGNALLARKMILEAFKVPAGSMLPTVKQGDHFFVDKGVYRKRAPRRGEIAVFDFPEHPGQAFVKRVIALPGDKLEVKEGRVFLNDWEVPRCAAGKWSYEAEGTHAGSLFVEYLDDAAYLVFHDDGGVAADYQGPFFVRDGEYFVLGDNRNNSHDSRMWFAGQGGGVARDKLFGRARIIWLSEGEPGRFAIDLAEPPAAPTGADSAAVEACLRERPPSDKRTPPAPKPH